MSHLFVNMASDWLVAPLEQAVYALAAGDVPLRGAAFDALPDGTQAILCRLSDTIRWALLPRPPSSVGVNGCLIPAGLHLLSDKDELRVQGSRFFFSTERLAQVEPFPRLGRAVACGRCRAELAVSSPAVCCPGCGSWCHASAEMPCWGYAPTCPLCQQRTDAETFSWTPAQL